jgi:hypothetical protein
MSFALPKIALMSDAEDDQREAAERDVRKLVVRQAEASGGWKGKYGYKDGTHPWADELIRQFTEARPSVLACPHLQAAPTQPSVWLPHVPDMLSCQRPECGQMVIATLEQRLGHSLADEPGHCSVCGKQALVRGVSVGVETTMIRALLCQACEQGSTPS